MSSMVTKLKNLKLDAGSIVSLSYSEGTDVFVHNESEVDTALSETDVVATVAELIATPKFKISTQYGTEVLDMLRSEGHLEEYERDETFTDYLCETISENFYDLELIDYSIQKYDYKRGFCTLSANFQAKISDILLANPFLEGWTVSVETEAGKLTL